MYFPNTVATASAFALWSLFSSTSTAASNPVVATPIKSTNCASYPSSPFLIQIVNSGNSSIEGFTDTVNWVDGPSAIRFGYLTFPIANDLAKTPLRCTPGSDGASQLQALVPTGVSGATWQDLQIAPIPYDATLIYSIAGSAPKIFEHHVDGKKQDGVFLGGYDNTTTWGVRYQTEGAMNQDFFYIRLLGPDSKDPETGKALFPGEFTAFIKVLGADGGEAQLEL